MYGFEDSSNVTGGQGKFGLNQGALITKFEYNANAGSEGASGDAIDVTVVAEGREYRKRFFPISKVFAKEGGEITDTNSEEYKEAHEKAVKMLNAELVDIVQCFIPVGTIKEALSVPIRTFRDFAQILERLVKSNPNWEKTPVDVFLVYQWNPRGEQTKTFLELPKNLKHGKYITSNDGTVYTPIEGKKSLGYINSAGVQHAFKRSEWFMESAFANQTDLEESNSDSDMNGGSTPASGANWGAN